MDIKRLFSSTPTIVLVRNELAEAERSLLEAQSAKEYASSMVVYHQARVDRLSKVLAEAMK